MSKVIIYPHTIDEINFATIKGDSYLVCSCGELLAENSPEDLEQQFKKHRKTFGLDSNQFVHHQTPLSNTTIWEDFTPQQDYI